MNKPHLRLLSLSKRRYSIYLGWEKGNPLLENEANDLHTAQKALIAKSWGTFSIHSVAKLAEDAGIWQLWEFTSNRKSTCFHVTFNPMKYCQIPCFCAPQFCCPCYSEGLSPNLGLLDNSIFKTDRKTHRAFGFCIPSSICCIYRNYIPETPS